MWPVAVGGGVACHLMLKDLFKLQHLWRTVAFRCQQHKASVRAVSLGLKSPGEGGGDTYRRQPQCPPCGIVTAFPPWENHWEEPVRAQDSAPQVRAAAGRYGAALPVPPSLVRTGREREGTGRRGGRRDVPWSGRGWHSAGSHRYFATAPAWGLHLQAQRSCWGL